MEPHGKAKLFGEQHRSVFTPLSLVDPNGETLDIDIISKQSAELGDSKTREVSKPVKQVMLSVATPLDGLEERR